MSVRDFKRLLASLLLLSQPAMAQLQVQQNGGNIIINGQRILGNGGLRILGGAGGAITIVNGDSDGQSQNLPLRSPRLTWKNGERSEGVLLSADDTTLTWQAEGLSRGVRGPIFADPLQLSSAALARVEFPADGGDTVTAEPFALSLVSGDLLYADIIGAAGADLKLRSLRHGEFTLPLASVHSIARQKDGGLIYSGPSGLSGWSALEPVRAGGVPPLIAAQGGSLVIGSWNRTARLNLQLGQKFEMRVKLSSTGRLQFGLGFTHSLASAIETWEDELVATWAGEFEPIRTLTDADKEIELRITLEADSGRMQIHDWQGKKLSEFSLPEKLGYAGIQLKNKGRDLTLHHLSVRAWDGQPLKQLPADVGYAELTDGTAMAGQLVADAAGLALKQGAAVTPIDLVKLRSYQLTERPQVQSAKGTRLWYADGSVVSGDIQAIVDRIVTLRQSSGFLSCGLDGLLRMTLAEGEWADAPLPDRLQIDREASLGGELKGSAEGKLQWLASAALRPVSLAPAFSGWEIERKRPNVPPATEASALFFLKDGQVFPGDLRGIDAEGVSLDSPVADTNKLSHTDLNAIHFRANAPQVGEFGSGGWRVLGDAKDKLLVQPGQITLLGETRYGHPSAMGGDEISFKLLMPESWGAVALRLFAEDIAQQGSQAVQLHFMQSNNDLWCAVEAADGTQRQSEQVRGLAKGDITVRLLVNDNAIQINVNDQPMLNASVPGDQRKGLGLVFGHSAMWGAGQQRRVVVRDFKTQARPDYVPVPHVPAQAKAQLLTVPRFRRESPPEHALMAPNGDLLRGKIESVSSTGLRFSSGLETVELPFQRLSSAVWLRKPLARKPDGNVVAPVDAFHPSHWLVLHDGARLALTLDKVSETELKGWCPSLGDCRISLDRLAMISTREQAPTLAMAAYKDWQLVSAEEPVLPETGGQSHPLLGKPAPAWVVRLLGGGTLTGEGEKGRVVVLDFWATWCGPCVASLPGTVALMSQFPQDRIRFVAVNHGEQDDQVQRFLTAKGLAVTVGMDSLQAMGKAFGVEALPHQVVIDAQGKVVWVNMGAGAEDKLRTAVEAALASVQP
jgi:thiol-disulfide isomerase/thioredoxin